MDTRTDGRPRIEIGRLSSVELPMAAEVIVNAFATEAITSFWVDLSSEKARYHYCKLAEARLQHLLANLAPLLTASEPGGELLGVAVVHIWDTPLSRRRLFFSLPALLPHLVGTIPFVKAGALRWIRQFPKALEPPEEVERPFLFLEAVGVRPGHQGKGIGTSLLDAVHRLADAQYLRGTYLATGDEINRVLYERVGYETVAVRSVGSVKIYHMFRPAGGLENS